MILRDAPQRLFGIVTNACNNHQFVSMDYLADLVTHVRKQPSAPGGGV